MNLSSRDPYPPKKFENDFTLSGYRPQHEKNWNKPTHMAQREDPWSRLHNSATHSSLHRSAMYCNDQAPQDDLDFQLKTVYDHHRDFFWSKSQMICQRDTVCEKHRHTESEGDKEAEQDQDIRRWVDPQKHSIYSFK